MIISFVRQSYQLVLARRFNVNIELARPECSFKFGFAEKLQYTLLLPVLIGVVLVLYSFVKLLLARRKGEDHFKKGHGGQTPVQFLTGQVVMILSAVFVFLSVFFLRTGVPRKCLHSSVTTHLATFLITAVLAL